MQPPTAPEAPSIASASPSAAAAPEALTIAATDGYPLAASLFVPAGGDPRRVVLVAPATGVRRKLYDAYARFLAGRGLGVLTWDWRGTGDSRPARLRGFRADMGDWARLDLAAMIDAAGARFPDAALVGVGHSFGGQGVGLAPNAHRLRRLLTVAAQNGWYGHWPRKDRWKYAFLWHVAMPGLVGALGYFPARRLGMGEDLPRGVALQWARWCRSPDFLGDWAGHRAFRAPVLALSFSDDPFAPRAAVDALVARYGDGRHEHRHVSPGDLGVRAIGHFGFFREGVGSPLWAETAEWLAGAESPRRESPAAAQPAAERPRTVPPAAGPRSAPAPPPSSHKEPMTSDEEPISERMVVVRTFSNEVDAAIAKATLEAHDIPVRVFSGGASVHPHVQFSTGVRVAVPESAVEDAEEALREVEEGELEDGEVDDGS